MTAADYHIPVLLRESVAGLAIRPGGIYVDLTFGGGGHSKEILKQMQDGTLVAFDQDPEAARNALSDSRFRFIHHNYRYFTNFLAYMGIDKVDGILADLGVSSHQIDEPSRGFSFRFDAPLDMRMNPAAGISAAELINTMSLNEMTHLLRSAGELNNARQLAQTIVSRRSQQSIENTGDLVAAVEHLLPPQRRHKILAQLFQAFRIAVNGELESLADMLQQAAGALKTGGRLVVISYHSLEDRLVKNYIKAGNPEGNIEKDLYGVSHPPFVAVNRQVVVADDNENLENPRARSAKLRIAERTVWD